MTKYLTEIDQALALNDVKKAEIAIAKALRSASSTVKDRAELLFRRARARLQAARLDDALEDLQTGLALQAARENDPDIKILRGDIYFARYELAPVGFAERADAEAALHNYQSIVENTPDHPHIAWVYYQMGRVKLSRAEVEEAAQYFKRAIKSPPYPANIYALSYERLGFIELSEHRDPATALQYFQKAIEHYPPQDTTGWLTQLYIRVSRAYLEMGQHEEALNAAHRALRDIQTGSTSGVRAIMPEAHMAVADVLAAIPGGEAEAIKHYLRFLQSSRRPPGIDVTWSQVHETIGQLSFKLERYQEAIDAYEKALEFNPYHPWEVNLRYQIARCYYRLRAYESSVEALQKMLASAQQDRAQITDWYVYNLLGNAYFALEQYEKAAEAYRTAIKLAPPGATEVERAEIYLRFSEELMGSGG